MKINEKKAGIILNYIGILTSILVSLLYTPYLLKSLGQAEYGIYTLVNSVIVYFTLFDFGFGNAVIRYTAKYRALGDEEAQEKLNGMIFLLYLIIGIVVAILGVILGFNTEHIFKALTYKENILMQKLVFIAVVNIALSFPFTVFKSIIQAYEKFFFYRLIELIKRILRPLTIVIILLLGHKAVGIVVATTILTIIFNIINMIYCLGKLKIKFKIPKVKAEWGILREVGVYSFFVFLNIIMDRLYWSTGQIILGIVQSSIAIAIFSLATQLSNIYMQFSTAMSSVFLPNITQIATKKENNYMEKLSNIFIKTGRIQFIILSLILTGFILFGKDFIYIWAGKEYNKSYIVALIMFIPLTIPLIQNVGISILQGLNKHRVRSIMYIIIAVINIGLSIPMAIKWGELGCAIATCLSLIAGQGIGINIYYSKIGLDMKKFWFNILKIIPGFIIPIGFGVLFNYVFDTTKILWLLISILIYTIIYIISVYFISMNKDEKEIIKKPIRFVIKKIKRG